MLTLEEVKVHLRLDGDAEDAYLEALVATATAYIAAVLTPAATEEVPTPAAPPVNDMQKHAARLLVGHWYANREAVSAGQMSKVPMAVDMLLTLNKSGEMFL